ncbi:MAG TPA: hypothetical protein PK777_00895 [Thermoguttaceae bacterium]|nr:hypothetical protein [Thermoguttaceae bacterium]
MKTDARIAAAVILALAFSATAAHAQTSRYRWTKIADSAAFAPRDGAGALTFNKQMWLLGGWNPSDKLNFPSITNSEVWSSTDGRTWTKRLAQAPWEGRHTAGYVVFAGKMWIIGGDANRGRYQSDVWNTCDGLNWTQVTPAVPWGPRALHYTLVHDNKLWVMGGQTMPDFVPGSPLLYYNDVWNSKDGKTWTLVTEHAGWSPRGMICGAVEFNNRMWIIGGGQYPQKGNPRTYYRDVWNSSDGKTWTNATAAAPWPGRNYHNVAVFDNRIWILGGYSPDKGRNLNDVWYSPDGAAWTQLPDPPWPPRHAASVFVFDNAMWIVTGNNMQSDVWRLDVIPKPSNGRQE